MTRYANVTCSRCFAIVPGNEITKVTDSTPNGRSESPLYKRDRYGGRHPDGFRITRHYSYKTLNLCPKCISIRRRHQFWQCCFLIAGFVTVISFVFAGQESVHRKDNGAATEVGYELSSSKSNGQKGILPQELAALPTAPSESETSKAPIIDEAPEEAFEPITPVLSSVLSDAIQKALSSGEPTRWKDADLAGYVVVSEPQPETGCRSMYYSIDTENPEWLSNVSVVCP